MADYIVRVELHSEQPGDYTKLHEQMENIGFSRYVRIAGINYHMPHATYLITTALTVAQVGAAAEAATKAVGRNAGVVAAQTTFATSHWSGLIPA